MLITGDVMTVSCEWLDEEHTIIRVGDHNPWSTDDYFEVSEELTRQMDSVNHTVDLIIDVANMTVPHDVFGRLRQALDYPPFNHPRHGMVVVVGASGRLALAAQMFSDIFHKLYFTWSVDEARARIAKTRQLPGGQ
jgi:hypothetical protein